MSVGLVLPFSDAFPHYFLLPTPPDAMIHLREYQHYFLPGTAVLLLVSLLTMIITTATNLTFGTDSHCLLFVENYHRPNPAENNYIFNAFSQSCLASENIGGLGLVIMGVIIYAHVYIAQKHLMMMQQVHIALLAVGSFAALLFFSYFLSNIEWQSQSLQVLIKLAASSSIQVTHAARFSQMDLQSMACRLELLACSVLIWQCPLLGYHSSAGPATLLLRAIR
jgi:hypothetical protein